ncbi:putative Meiotic regulator-interacting [Histomonas meleagridis]|uniref:putative Meiotic regulator-interacting n=1 Tax=Histomonas meleagridis TaxID=135588 RepID=UPI00355991D7|nr:putative Meiotic regulator-interacting [Histomonas meleagridis]KAH0805349.1 putative Meiotic regulator-interacting [Histomonas meleagridis]
MQSNIQSVSDYMDSSDFDEWESDNEEMWQQPKLEESIQDMFPIYHNILSNRRKPRRLSKYSIEDDFDSVFFNKSIPEPEYIDQNSFEATNTILVNFAHSTQLPKPNSSYTSTLPCILAWINTRNSFSSEYPNMMQQYFKSHYTAIRPHLRYFFSIAPSSKRLNNFSIVRHDVPNGRVLFHYIGYGFPDITSKGIWCSEKRSCVFTPYSFSSIFKRLTPPTSFLFDCSNAEVAIEGFKSYVSEICINSPTNSPNDWVCVCATSEGEKLPDDPKLPKDFLTSAFLTPVKMALLCHMVQYYRLSLEPTTLDPPCQHLWDDKSPDSARLSIALTSIIDGIAADSLPRDLYMKLFRNDVVTFNLFKAYLLSQYLLRPYGIHPKSYPSINDLSVHPLWRQWSILLDTAICSVSIPRPSFANDMYNRLSTTFEVLIRNRQFDLIRPYHLILLFYDLVSDPKNDKPLMLLSEYATADPKSSPSMFALTTFFPSLFGRLLSKDPKSPIFAPLCFLIICVLFYKPSFSNEVQNDFDISNFPEIPRSLYVK